MIIIDIYFTIFCKAIEWHLACWHSVTFAGSPNPAMLLWNVWSVIVLYHFYILPGQHVHLPNPISRILTNPDQILSQLETVYFIKYRTLHSANHDWSWWKDFNLPFTFQGIRSLFFKRNLAGKKLEVVNWNADLHKMWQDNKKRKASRARHF